MPKLTQWDKVQMWMMLDDSPFSVDMMPEHLQNIKDALKESRKVKHE